MSNINNRIIGMPNKPINILNRYCKDYKSYLPIYNRFTEMINWLTKYKIMLGEIKKSSFRV